jgi:6-phosphogluconolactonase
MSELHSIETVETREHAARLCADWIAAELRGAISQKGKASFVATGGSTPIECYRHLAAEDLDWSKVTVTLSDERWVDTFSPDSNENMVRQTLMVGAASGAHFIPLKARRGGYDEGAKRAEIALRMLAPFDVVLLGMGEDGHFASLFPGHPALVDGLDVDSARLCLGVSPGEPAPTLPRVSLTLAALTQSRIIIVLITGDAKRAIVDAPDGKPIAALLAQTKTPVRIVWAP